MDVITFIIKMYKWNRNIIDFLMTYIMNEYQQKHILCKI